MPLPVSIVPNISPVDAGPVPFLRGTTPGGAITPIVTTTPPAIAVHTMNPDMGRGPFSSYNNPNMVWKMWMQEGSNFQESTWDALQRVRNPVQRAQRDAFWKQTENNLGYNVAWQSKMRYDATVDPQSDIAVFYRKKAPTDDISERYLTPKELEDRRRRKEPITASQLSRLYL